MRQNIGHRVLNFVTLVFTLLAVTVVAYRAYQWQQQGRPYSKIRDSESYRRGGSLIGTAVAPVQVVIFSDFQCPYCKAAQQLLEHLQRSSPTLLAIRYRHYPLQSHTGAMMAAIAASCSATFGRFEQMHDYIFAHTDSLMHADWTQWASQAGVSDTSGFRKCVADSQPLPLIKRDIAEGHRLGIDGTPAIIVGDRLFRGYPDTTQLQQAIKVASENSQK